MRELKAYTKAIEALDCSWLVILMWERLMLLPNFGLKSMDCDN